VGDAHPLDQHYMRNPDELFTKPNASLNIDVENNLILTSHLQCAAYEMPVHPITDCKYFGNEVRRLCQECLVEDEEGFYHCHPKYRPYPSLSVNIRGIEEEVYAVIDITNNKNILMEEIDVSRAIFSIYEGKRDDY
jgi:DEAD/DEAH box helicase domain-containing protein